MATYRKKSDSSVSIEAVQFDPHRHPWPDGVQAWPKNGYRPRDMSWGYIETPDGDLHVRAGDYIVTTEGGARFPCIPGVLEATYEPVERNGDPAHHHP